MSLLKQTPVFKSKDSIATLVLVSVEAILLSILEGLVVMNHLALVSNCNMDRKGQGIYYTSYTSCYNLCILNLLCRCQ